MRERTGLTIDPYFSGDQDRVAAAQRRGRRAGGLRHDRLLAALQADRAPRHRLLQRLADDAVRHPPARLGRGAVRAARGRPGARCREPLPSAHVYGTTTEFGGEVPVAGIAGDQQAALFGQACHRPGMAKNTYGTGSFVLLNTGPEAPPPGRRPAGHRRLGRSARRSTYALEASIFVTGAAVQWLRDGLGIIDDGGGDGGAGGLARLQRRRLLRPRPDRARLAALGPLRARHDRRPHPRQRPRPPGAGGAGGDRLPDRRRGARPGGGAGERLEVLKADGGAVANALADAVPGRRARRPGGGAGDRRDDRARRRLPGRDRDRALDPRAGGGDVARGGPLRAADGRGRARVAAGRLAPALVRALAR